MGEWVGWGGVGVLCLLSDPTPVFLVFPLPCSYNLLPRIIEAKYLDAMDAEH